jgi:hypothetical protein
MRRIRERGPEGTGWRRSGVQPRSLDQGRVQAGPALVGAKTLAAACGVLLYLRGFHGILGALTGLYMLLAITPWLFVFHNL